MCHDGNGHQTIRDTHGIVERDLTISTTNAELPVFVAEPEGGSSRRVIIIHDIFGANVFYHDLARRLASAGFSAHLPDLFVRQGQLAEETFDAARARSGLLSYPQAIEDVGRVVDEIGEDGKIGAVGFCMGGTLVMHLAAQEPRLDAGVIYYGFPANRNLTENRPSEPLRETDQIQAPLLGFWGDQDQGVGMDNVEQYRSQLTDAGKDFDFTIYPGLPHGFLTFDESSDQYNESQDSWRKSLAFFEERLGE